MDHSPTHDVTSHEQMLWAVQQIYDGSKGDWTRDFYAQLTELGSIGVVAMNVFRAMKASARAKVYKGGDKHGSFRDQAYDKKHFSLYTLIEELGRASALGTINIQWGWRRDVSQPFADWVLYLELPTGQVSFHSPVRGMGPDFKRPWDEAKGTGPERIVRWCAQLLHGGTNNATDPGHDQQAASPQNAAG